MSGGKLGKNYFPSKKFFINIGAITNELQFRRPADGN